MNLYQVVQVIRETSLGNPGIQTFIEGSVTTENIKPAQEYPVIILTHDTHSINTNYNSYRFYMTYVDRLTRDRSNRLEVQSTAITTLQEIVNRLIYDEKFSPGLDIVAPDYTYSLNADVFTEDFSNECAGAIINFTINEENLGECFY